jgi:hypothetical protein
MSDLRTNEFTDGCNHFGDLLARQLGIDRDRQNGVGQGVRHGEVGIAIAEVGKTLLTMEGHRIVDL